VRQPRRPSQRQLTLPLECETPIRLVLERQAEVIGALADLLLEAMGAAASSKGEPDESQD